ncbi:uncharacterized protein M421DRAFT_415674 [Didymella exigua CBS 183.55]|uniref:Uncharacterized protein n=1 Tax=Didymella exigua CBS 183.55 TaxID=1150837 RepID=A0A6A5S746_9PLEO|nr:uncharacterized protein M421DRAFT_415674 [Didymella exigua CBS 183.55]KAF1933337.1 hypothetical protein M421DRAFT_415674 [Didymella exigua CBS 183.55]
MALSDSLLDPLWSVTKDAIANTFWDQSGTLNQPSHHVIAETYWQFYVKECERALHDGGRHVLVRTHQDILDIAKLVLERKSREDIRQRLRLKLTKSHDNEDELINRAIDLAATLLLMVDCTNVEYGFNGHHQLEWEEGSLNDCVRLYLDSKPALGHEGVKLPRIFNAKNLECIAGIEVLPTSNLLDHLRLTDDDTKLHVFHHMSYLKRQTKSAILPEALLEETQRTLSLLFPQSDPTVRRWCRKALLRPSFDSQLISCGALKTDDRQIEKFAYWHDRLVVLKQLFDEATPQTLSQWWHDRRNGVQWYTFWVAILILALTIFFGFIQSVEGALQVWASFKGEE